MAFARCTERSFSLPFLMSPPIKLDLDSSLLNSFNLSYEESDGTPLQYSCLENPMDGGAWWPAVNGVAKSWTRLHFHFHFSLSCIGEGNVNPFQCSCLETPRDGAAWCAGVYGVAQNRTEVT